MMQEIKNDLGTFQKTDDGVILITPKENSKVTESMAREIISIVKSLKKEDSCCLLVDNRSVSSIERNARKLFAFQDNNLNINAVAIIVKTPLSITIVNFFMKLEKLSKPVKLFTSIDQARNWLKDYL